MGLWRVGEEGPNPDPCSSPGCMCFGGPVKQPPLPAWLQKFVDQMGVPKNACTLKLRCPLPPQVVQQLVAGVMSNNTTYAKVLTADGNAANITRSDCFSLPLKGGGALSLSWTRISGLTAAQARTPDNWQPAGVGVFGFLPLVNQTNTGGMGNERRRISDQGAVVYSDSDVPDVPVPYVAKRGTTYWTEYHQNTDVYFEYFAGSSMSGDPMFGRLNRVYSLDGLELSYWYSPNGTGNQLLRRITGLSGNTVPYFGYANEAIGPHASEGAAITTIHVVDLDDATQNRSVYFEYHSINFGYPYLTKVVLPSGCTRQYYPDEVADGFYTYRISREVDAEGNTTYFNYSGLVISSSVEPSGRLVYYDYTAGQTVRIDTERPSGTFKYQTNAAGNCAFPISQTDELGYTTYFTNDASIGRHTAMVEANGNRTSYGYMGGSSTPQALTIVTRDEDGSRTYFQYDQAAGVLRVKAHVWPRHIEGSYPVVAYYEYDNESSPLRVIDPLGNITYYAYSAAAVIREVDARGAISYFEYTGPGVTKVVDPLGATIHYGITNMGAKLRGVSPRWPEGPSMAAFTTYYAYDLGSRPLRSIDPLGGVTYFDWTASGRPLATVDARGTEIEYTYDNVGNGTSVSITDASGKLLSRTLHGMDVFRNRVREQDALGNVTYFVYNSIEQPLSVLDALGNRTYFEYDSVGNLVRQVDALQNPTYFFFDRLSRLKSQRDAQGGQSYFFYDVADNVTCALDARLSPTYYFYDKLNRVQATRDVLGNPTYFYFDAVGNTTAVRDARFVTTYFFYDGMDRRTVLRDALGRSTYFGYDRMGNLIRTFDARLNATYYSYDVLDRLSSKVDALGNTNSFFMDAVGNVTVVKDARGNAAYFGYDGLSRRSASRDALGNGTYFFYDLVGNRTAERDALGNLGYFFYDALQQPTVIRDPLANSTYFFYDAVGNRTHQRDARGNTTYHFYDSLRRVTKSRDSLGGTSYFFYDAAGNATSVRDVRGNAAYFTYDVLGRLSQTSLPAGSVIRSGFDAVGNVIRRSEVDDVLFGGYGVQPYGTSSYGGRLAVTYFFYDELSQVTALRDPLSNLTYFTYDEVGNRTQVRNALSHVTYFGYDALNRLTRVQDTLGGATYFEFDAVGNPIKVLDADQHALQTRYDSLNRTDAILLPDGASSYFFFDAVSSRTKEIDPRGNPTYYGYDALRRWSRIQDALGRSLYFEYDAVGNLSRAVDSESGSKAYTYDVLNRRTNCGYSPAGSETSASLRSDPYYVYDEAGNLTQMGDLWGLSKMGYDVQNRLVRRQYPQGQVVYFEYTFRSQVKGIVYPGSSGRLSASDDLLQRQVFVQSPSGTTAYFTYDAVSNLTQRFLGNSAKQDATFDAAERIQKWRASDKNGASLTYFDYTRDTKGLITKAVRETTHMIYYAYDANDRLTLELWATTGGSPAEVYGYRYEYDQVGNRTKQRVNGQDSYYFYDQANQLTVSGSTSAWATPTYYLYDQNGSLTDLVEPGGTTRFAYNAAGLAARIRWQDASSTYFFYDGAEKLYAMVEAGATTATYFLWDGPNLLQELNADGTVKEEHTNAQTPVTGIGQLVETNRPGQTPQKLYPVMDPRGTITKWIQSDGTTVQAAREYDTFGNLIPNSETGTWVTRFSYQGQSWWAIRSADGLKTLYKSLRRDYDPVTGRFLQNEPLLGRRPFAQYLYAAQSPVSFVDPLGLAGCDASLSKKIETFQCANAPETTYKRAPNDAVEGLLYWDKKYEDAFRAELSGNTRQEIDQLLSRRRPLREQMDAAPGTFTYLVNTLTLGLLIDINQMNAAADKAAREYDAITNRLLSIEKTDPRYPRILRRQNDWIEPVWNPLEDPIFAGVSLFTGPVQAGATALRTSGVATAPAVGRSQQLQIIYRGQEKATEVLLSPLARQSGFKYAQGYFDNIIDFEKALRLHQERLALAIPEGQCKIASPFVSASNSLEVAAISAGPKGVVYVIRMPEYAAFDVNRFLSTHGGTTRFAFQNEVVIPAGVDPRFVIEAIPVEVLRARGIGIPGN